MCCKPKSSFLIEDILQNSPTKTNERLDPAWPARPTPMYLNQVQTLHQTSNIIRVPTLTTATPTARSVYLSEEFCADDRLRIHDYSFHRHPQILDPVISGAHYRAGFGRCWTMLPGYSLAVLPRHIGHSKRKGGQVRFTPEQTASLERRFREHKYLSPEDRRHLAAQLKLSDRQVKTWFQNRRAKWRRANASTSTTDESHSDDTGSSNTVMDEDVFDTPSHSPINVLS